MKVIDEYSHKNGKEWILQKFPEELQEVYSIIETINLNDFRTKESKEKTTLG